MAYITDEDGNWKRTVRCGYCYEKGHNQSACPKRKKDLKNNIERYTRELAETDRPADDYQVRNTERYLRHSIDQLQKMESRGKNRKCGYCNEPGHTRRTCPHRIAKVDEALAATIDARKRIVERMVIDGFGPGALINVGNEHETVLAVVDEVRVGDIGPNHVISKDGYFYGCQAISYQYVVPHEDQWGGRPLAGGMCYIPAEYLNIDDIPENEWYTSAANRSCTLLSGADVREHHLLTDDNFNDKKKLRKWVTNVIVDPK